MVVLVGMRGEMGGEQDFQLERGKGWRKYDLLSSRQCHRFPELSQVAPEQKGASHRYAEHFVRRNSDSVRSLNTLKSTSLQLSIEDKASTPATVDVEPESMFLAHVCNFVERVERSQNCRTRSRVHEEWRFAFGFAILHHGV